MESTSGSSIMALRSVDGSAIESPEGFPLAAILAAPWRRWSLILAPFLEKALGIRGLFSYKLQMRQNMGHIWIDNANSQMRISDLRPGREPLTLRERHDVATMYNT